MSRRRLQQWPCTAPLPGRPAFERWAERPIALVQIGPYVAMQGVRGHSALELRWGSRRWSSSQERRRRARVHRRARTVGRLAVGYAGRPTSFAATHATDATVVRTLAPLHVAEVRGERGRAAQAAGDPFRAVRARPRSTAAEPASTASAPRREWQFRATHTDVVPDTVLRSAAAVTIAVIDTGADISAPDVAAKSPVTWNTRTGTSDVRDTNGHGTFVASLAAGSVTNGDGISGAGGDAQLLVIKSGQRRRLVHRHGRGSGDHVRASTTARASSISASAGPTTSATEKRAIQYAVEHGALVVAAVGNEFGTGNPVEYPAALLQPRRLERHRRRRPRRDGVDGGRQACLVREHRLLGLARGARRSRLRRRLVALLPARLSPLGPARREVRPVRLRQRHVVRDAAGRRRGGARLGGEPVADGTAGGADPQGDGDRRRPLDAGPRLRRHRRRRGGRARAAEQGRRPAQRSPQPPEGAPELERRRRAPTPSPSARTRRASRRCSSTRGSRARRCRSRAATRTRSR